MIEVDGLLPLLPRLPIFPLPAAQLFPRTLLPLHVFEPRYRALVRDALAGERLVGIPMLEPGYEADYGGRPAVRPICGVGQIVQSHLHPDGRYDLLLRGLGRVRIVEELPPAELYRLVRAERLDEPPPGRPLAADLSALVALCDRLATVLPSGSETLRELVRQESEPGAVCDVVASALLTEPGDRQRLLETLDVATRLERLCDAVVTLLGRLRGSESPDQGQLN